MRIFPVSCLAALLMAGLGAPSRAQSAEGHHSLTPQYQRHLDTEIQACAQKVNTAKSPEERCQQQEDLCKKLLKAEDYENAAKVALAVHSTKGVNAERRAAHHFLVAQIYAMQMEAATSVRDMEACRQKALSVAQDVVGQRYPAEWTVGAAAERLLRELEDPQRRQMVCAKVSKRQSGGLSADLTRVAAAQGLLAALGDSGEFAEWGGGEAGGGDRPGRGVQPADGLSRPGHAAGGRVSD